MTESGRYRYLDHTADIGIEAEAPDPPALFAICARALFDIIVCEGVHIEESSTLDIRVEAPDLEILLVRWLRELLYLHEAEGWLFAGFHVATKDGPGGTMHLDARVSGERLDPSRHRLETELKAVTYHQLHVRRAQTGEWRARVILDV